MRRLPALIWKCGAYRSCIATVVLISSFARNQHNSALSSTLLPQAE
jgi:hypothetical protein